MHFALESTFLPTLIANIVNQKLQEDLKKIITSQYFLHYQSLSDLLKQFFFSADLNMGSEGCQGLGSVV